MRNCSPLLLFALGALTVSAAAQSAPALAALKPATTAPAAGNKAQAPVVPPAKIAAADLPADGQVRVEILELTAYPSTMDPKKGLGVDASWTLGMHLKTEEYLQPSFAFAALPSKYLPSGVQQDRSIPYLVRAAAVVTLPPGENRLLVRSLGGARLAVDGTEVANTPHNKQKGGDNEPVPDQAAVQLVPGLRLLPGGHKEAMAMVQGDGRPHVISLEAFVGGRAIRPEVGELAVAVSHNGGPFRLLTPAKLQQAPALNDSGWRALAEEQEAIVHRLNAQNRRNPGEETYWAKRHALARQHAKPAPAVPGSPTAGGAIDRFISVKLEEHGVRPSAKADDAAYLRRVTLDTIGLLPTAEEVQAFLNDPSPNKREKLVDRLLADTRWADRWTPYWQDVLAENPVMLKGTLNNTGPFRFWIHESLQDNKPFDRFVTDLIQMEGSEQYGGPAGFGIATQNDLPMAAKAQIISSAFLAMEMKCARCHDAPSHPFNQEELFNLAAMLGRKEVTVPTTSLTQGLSENSHVTVSLKAGQVIPAHFPFAELRADPLPGVLRRSGDSREQLAAILTDPRRDRMAQVVVNRMWKELIGVGIVEPVDDWENASPSHPELLAWLAHDFITHGYDLKHLARQILLSDVYGRVPTTEGSRVEKQERLFASPARRRMSAEQLVDSLVQISGKPFDCEMLTMDIENRQPASAHTNLGVPQRAWQFTSGSNERDRPALAKPRAQVVTDVLTTFGWRDSRAEPRSTREQAANVLQPALLANGSFGTHTVRLDEASAFTALALQEQPVEALVDELYRRILSRQPTATEQARLVALLAPGYADRRTGRAPAAPRPPVTQAVSWANHLHPEATRVVMRVEQAVREGDPVTTRLVADWRERMEDAVWALTLSPEYLYLP